MSHSFPERSFFGRRSRCFPVHLRPPVGSRLPIAEHLDDKFIRLNYTAFVTELSTKRLPAATRQPNSIPHSHLQLPGVDSVSGSISIVKSRSFSPHTRSSRRRPV